MPPKFFPMKLLFSVLFLCFFTMGHAPWGQHNVYRQIHMLIMCSKKDETAFNHLKTLVSYFNDYLPKSKARAARAPHEERILALLETNQIPLALFSYDYLEKITDDNEKNFNFFSKEVRVIFFFPNMVLISNKDFPIDKSTKIFKSLIKASKEKVYKNLKYEERPNFFIPLDDNLKK